MFPREVENVLHTMRRECISVITTAEAAAFLEPMLPEGWVVQPTHQEGVKRISNLRKLLSFRVERAWQKANGTGPYAILAELRRLHGDDWICPTASSVSSSASFE